MMRAVYQFQNDDRMIAAIQKATRTTEQFGIEPTHGIVGTDEWWSNIRTGALKVHTLRGRISRVYMGSMRDWPEFTLTLPTGEASSWTREADTVELSELYVEGRDVELDYVLQHHRKKSWDGGDETKFVLAIRVADVA
jgi:hypothetical protein